jgi:hypothetical protein
LARWFLAKIRARLPGATELLYDKYNALAIGSSLTDIRVGSFILLSVTVAARTGPVAFPNEL